MRQGKVERNTKETQIAVELDLDGTGKADISTGVGFLDHMLTLLPVHSFMDLKVRAKGDLEVDCHHTVEDVGIALGQAIAQALGDKKGIHRYGSFLLPMDEALAEIALDFSGRPYLAHRERLLSERDGGVGQGSGRGQGRRPDPPHQRPLREEHPPHAGSHLQGCGTGHEPGGGPGSPGTRGHEQQGGTVIWTKTPL